jgi:hypothetical protein
MLIGMWTVKIVLMFLVGKRTVRIWSRGHWYYILVKNSCIFYVLRLWEVKFKGDGINLVEKFSRQLRIQAVA